MEALLEAYYMHVDFSFARLAELRDATEDTEDLAEISLDSQRNRLIKIDLVISNATLAVGVFGVVAGAFGSLDTSVNVAFPAIAEAFDLAVADLQWIVVTYVLTYGALLVAAGRLGDSFGHHRIVRIGALVSLLGLGACAAAPGYAVFLVGRVVQGLGAALVMAGFLFTGSTERSASPASAAAPAYASVVYDEPTGMSWLVTAHANSHKMTVVAMGDYEVPEGKVLRAWLKPENGEPVLLGKWPNTHGDHEMTVSDTAAQHMNEPAKLMVSMEDAGTSAQASVPSGKLMWTSPIARRTG